jgi:hypothetical protein
MKQPSAAVCGVESCLRQTKRTKNSKAVERQSFERDVSIGAMLTTKKGPSRVGSCEHTPRAKPTVSDGGRSAAALSSLCEGRSCSALIKQLIARFKAPSAPQQPSPLL